MLTDPDSHAQVKCFKLAFLFFFLLLVYTREELNSGWSLKGAGSSL